MMGPEGLNRVDGRGRVEETIWGGITNIKGLLKSQKVMWKYIYIYFKWSHPVMGKQGLYLIPQLINKNPIPGMGYLFWHCWPMRCHKPPNTTICFQRH